MPSIPAAVATIQAAAAPVVFLDSCVLLDIIRAPLRDAASTVAAAADLRTGARRTPPSVFLVVACPTPTEWNDHVDEVAADCTAAIRTVDAVSQSWGFLGLAGIPTLPLAALALPDRLRDLSKEVLDAAILLDKDNEALGRAVDRLIHARLPVRKHGQGAKDAIILEHALGLTHALRNAGFAHACIFVSSNTGDFARPKTTQLHSQLQPDFDPPTDLRYAASLPLAVALLKAGGWAP